MVLPRRKVLTLVDSLIMGLVKCRDGKVLRISWQLTRTAFPLLPKLTLMAPAIKRYGRQLHRHVKQRRSAFSLPE